MVSVLAALLFLPVLPLQFLGYTGTCTQNDTDPFLAGVVLSAPFALASLTLTVSSTRRMRASPSSRGHPVAGSSSVVLFVLAALDVVMNLEMAKETLVQGLSPCGPDHTESGHLFEPEHVLIGCAYGVLPSLVAVAAAYCFWAALPKRSR